LSRTDCAWRSAKEHTLEYSLRRALNAVPVLVYIESRRKFALNSRKVWTEIYNWWLDRWLNWWLDRWLDRWLYRRFNTAWWLDDWWCYRWNDRWCYRRSLGAARWLDDWWCYDWRNNNRWGWSLGAAWWLDDWWCYDWRNNNRWGWSLGAAWWLDDWGYYHDNRWQDNRGWWRDYNTTWWLNDDLSHDLLRRSQSCRECERHTHREGCNYGENADLDRTGLHVGDL